MSYQKSTKALKNEVLEICGELTDGTSDFEGPALRYLNNLYQGLLSGGNEFGIDAGDPWVWAQSKRPINLSLQPYYSGSLTIANGGLAGVLSVAPSFSLEGRFVRILNRADMYRVVKHDAGDTDIQFDQPYLETGGLLSFTAFKTEYALTDDTIVIDYSNNKIDFRESNSATLTAVLPRGSYTPTTLSLAIKVAMQTVGSQTYTVTFDSLTRKFSIAQGGAYFDLPFANGPSALTSVSSAIGFDIEDYSGSLSYGGSYALSGIMRLTKPIQTYRSGIASGQIFMVDDNSFARDYSYGSVLSQMPDKFCVSEQNASGIWKIKTNASVFREQVRCEVSYIPIARKLTDSDASFPVVPTNGVQYLVAGAAHYLMTDKSDSKAEQFKGIAMAKLQALINDNRKNATLAGSDYGRLVPRGRTISRPWGY